MHHTSKICVSLMEWILIYFFVIYDLKCNMLFRSLLNLKQLDVYLAIRSFWLLNYNIWNQYVFILLFSLLGDLIIPEVIVVHHNFSMSSISSVILIEFFIKIIAFNSLSILWGQGIRKVRRIKFSALFGLFIQVVNNNLEFYAFVWRYFNNYAKIIDWQVMSQQFRCSKDTKYCIWLEKGKAAETKVKNCKIMRGMNQSKNKNYEIK